MFHFSTANNHLRLRDRDRPGPVIEIRLIIGLSSILFSQPYLLFLLYLIRMSFLSLSLQLKPGKKIRTAQEFETFASRGKMHGPYGLDYFITHADGFRWADIPPFVIGSTKFDNWVVSGEIYMERCRDNQR